MSGADDREWAAVFGPLSTDEERDEAERNSLARIRSSGPHAHSFIADLASFGVRFVDDDEVIGVYWLPAPKGQPVAGSLREALDARAEELRSEAADAQAEVMARRILDLEAANALLTERVSQAEAGRLTVARALGMVSEDQGRIAGVATLNEAAAEIVRLRGRLAALEVSP